MGHKNKKTLVKQVSDELDSQFKAGKGQDGQRQDVVSVQPESMRGMRPSRHLRKKAGAQKYIFSDQDRTATPANRVYENRGVP
jgi:hypothetical protein